MRVIKIIIILLQQSLRLSTTSASACELETWSGQQSGLNAWRTEAKVEKCFIFCFQNSRHQRKSMALCPQCDIKNLAFLHLSALFSPSEVGWYLPSVEKGSLIYSVY